MGRQLMLTSLPVASPWCRPGVLVCRPAGCAGHPTSRHAAVRLSQAAFCTTVVYACLVARDCQAGCVADQEPFMLGLLLLTAAIAMVTTSTPFAFVAMVFLPGAIYDNVRIRGVLSGEFWGWRPPLV